MCSFSTRWGSHYLRIGAVPEPGHDATQPQALATMFMYALPLAVSVP